MISASEIHELRFEKAAFGYKQEDIDEFLNKLEEEAAIAQRELDDSNNKIQVLADKVREYMRDEDALKDALLGAQKEGHRIISEANAKAEEIIAQAKEKADAMMDEVTVQHSLKRMRQRSRRSTRNWQLQKSRSLISKKLSLTCTRSI